jgi:DNA-directed RNA polymerase III subunit RPC4
MLTSATDRKNNPNRGYSGFGSGTGSRAERVKNEDGSYGSSGHRSGGGGDGGGSSIKREGEGMVSSDEEEDDVTVPRRDIDLIEISSDEDESKPKNVPTPRARAAALPVRIGRKEHQERTFGINTDASSETSAKLLEKAESTGQSLQAVAEQTTRKGKSKSKDVEITGSRKQFKGVWHDSEDSDVLVKTEPTSDEENMADAVQFGLPNAPAQPAEKQEPQSPDAERKPKAKIKSIAEPVLQTDEDRAEWARFQSNLRHIRAELGPEEISQVDGSGDVVMAEASSSTEKKPTVRDNNVYLFQIPPLMPALDPPTIKDEASDPIPLPKPAQPAAKPGDPKIKLEEGGFSDPSARSNEGPRFGSGMVGKLRVHESGRTTLDWGGTSYELTPGNKASFLQEVTSLRIEPPAERVVPEAGGDAVSFGRVKGKFVVVPNWGEMLG